MSLFDVDITSCSRCVKLLEQDVLCESAVEVHLKHNQSDSCFALCKRQLQCPFFFFSATFKKKNTENLVSIHIQLQAALGDVHCSIVTTTTKTNKTNKTTKTIYHSNGYCMKHWLNK